MTSVGTRVRKVMSLPPRGKYQVRAIRFLEANKGRGILGDIMGLGKTYEAIGWMAIHPEIRKVVVVGKASVKYQWQNMLREVGGISSSVLSGRTPYLPTEDVAVLNYDILAAATWPGGVRRKGVRPQFPWVKLLRSQGIDLVIIDECQKIKNRGSLRSQACKQLCQGVPHVIGCSGTLIDKAPVEFFPILQIVAPKEFTSFWKYVMAYCDPKRAFRGRGWDFSGSSNLDELHERIKPWIIRCTSREGLPPKNRSILPIQISNRRIYNEAEYNFLGWVERNQGKKAKEKASNAVGLTKMGVLKRIAASGKIQALKFWIKDYLEENEDKLTVFAIHHDTINSLQETFPSAAVYNGRISPKRKEEEKRRFLEDPSCRVFIGQMEAAGEGVDGLQRVSSTALFAELGWNWSDHEQAEDRILRPGQTAQSINVYYMVGKDTMEEPLLDLIQAKADIVHRVLHGSILGPLFKRRSNAGLCIQS